MNGPEHYREAERLLELADTEPEASILTGYYVAAAQAHATLALAAATAYDAVRDRLGLDARDSWDWTEATRPAEVAR